jgi:hypothetical protein
MTASDSSTNLAWLINQNAPDSTRRQHGEGRHDDKEPQRTHTDFGAMQIEPEPWTGRTRRLRRGRMNAGERRRESADASAVGSMTRTTR